MNDSTANTLIGKPVFYTGHGGNKREVGLVMGVESTYTGAQVRVNITDPELAKLLTSPSAGAIEVAFKL